MATRRPRAPCGPGAAPLSSPACLTPLTLYAETRSPDAAHPPRRLLLHGVRAARVLPHLLGRPRHPGRRLHQGRGRPEAAGDRHRACCGSAATRSSASAPTASRTRSSPRFDHSFLRDTGVHVRVNVRGHEVPCNVWVTTRFGHVPLYLIEPARPEDRWITHRLYEAGTDVRIAQEMLLGIGGVRALTWLGIPIVDLPLQRGARRLRRHRDDRRAHGGRAAPSPTPGRQTRREIVFTTHTPVKAGNEEHSLKDLRRMGACLQLSGAEMRAIGGDPFNMTVAGLRLAARGQRGRRSCTARPRARCGSTSPTPRPSSPSRTACTCPPGSRPRCAPPGTTPSGCGRRTACTGRELLAEIERREGLRAGPRGAHHRLRPPRRQLQAPRPDRARRGAPAAACSRSGVHIVLAGKSHPDDKLGKTIIARLVERRAAAPRAGRLPRELRHGAGAHAHARLRRVAQQPHPPARGQRHLGHEGGDERRAQPEHPRRLVARGLRARRERLGHRRRDVGRRREGPGRALPTCSRARCCPPGPTATAGSG